jgi:hypothetical protein
VCERDLTSLQYPNLTVLQAVVTHIDTTAQVCVSAKRPRAQVRCAGMSAACARESRDSRDSRLALA